jgi:hypothetical protein
MNTTSAVAMRMNTLSSDACRLGTNDWRSSSDGGASAALANAGTAIAARDPSAAMRADR